MNHQKKSQKRRRVSRWLVWAVVVAVAAVGGIIKRERLRSLISRAPSPRSAATPERKILYWVDPMHPAYRSDRPGTAPDCGMDLIPVYEEGGVRQTAATLPAGAFQISSEKQQLIGVKYQTVGYQPLLKRLRTIGRVAYDEMRISHVHTRVEGWIEDVFVHFTGKQVKQGEPLLTIYSPELLQTQQEYLLARKGRQELAASPFREAVEGSESLLHAARRRLELWDIGESQIRRIEQTGQPIKALTLNAPADGFVLVRNAFPRQRVTPDTELYTIADLSSIWVIADVYEYEAPEIKIGQRAEITLTYLPGKTYHGKVTFISPQLDVATRTLKARIEIPNPGFKLKLDMFANVDLQIDYGNRLVVPVDAVMDSGAEQTVFVAHEGGYFEPRQIETGARVDNQIIVLAGLKAGERVVTSANFLIDSESKLKSAVGGMGSPQINGGVSDSPAQIPPARGSAGRPKQAPAVEDHPDHRATQPESPGRGVAYWTCRMHPEVRSDKPGKCPICKMNLVPKYADDQPKP